VDTKDKEAPTNRRAKTYTKDKEAPTNRRAKT
jgi:hypothetical protein